jgi:serine/threonine-protein kinase RsbW
VDRRKGPRAILVYSDIFPSCLEAVETVLARMMGKLTELGCLDGQRDEVDLALREALVNAVKHGNRGQLNKRVELDCFQQHDGGILLVVRDEGPGFDPAHIADPTEPDNIFRTSGRGILLIRSFMDEVQFQRGGREIRMKKQPTRSS